MHEYRSSRDEGSAVLAELIRALRGLEPGVDDAVRIDRIRLLEELKSVAAAVQAAETAAFAASQRAAQAAAGVPAERVGRGIAGQVALAKRVSPWAAQRYVGWAGILTTELSQTFDQLRAGRTSEWRAVLVARETLWLSREHRAVVDAALAPRLETLGDRGVEREAKQLAYRLDPHGCLARLRGAERDRRVSLRPAPDVMARLTAFVPAAQGVAMYAALMKAADAGVAGGDARGRGQLMADTLVERVTGQASAGEVPVEVEVVLDGDALLASADEPAQLAGYGPIPAHTARELIGTAGQAWLRRLFRAPGSGELVAMESRRRCFTPAQRRFIRLRDEHCRTPWCEAPIRHTDHIRPAEQGGPTTVPNGQGLCQACNHAKQAPGWQARPSPTGYRAMISTPTGHLYFSRAPDPPAAA